MKAVEGPEGWIVEISGPDRTVLSTRACADGTEARIYASTVRQHIYWLSEPTFRRYYRLPEPD